MALPAGFVLIACLIAHQIGMPNAGMPNAGMPNAGRPAGVVPGSGAFVLGFAYLVLLGALIERSRKSSGRR